MKLSIGIVGLPNVGKSTLFNALLKKQIADIANYPFCTIEPNVGIIEVPDDRLPALAKIVKTEKIVPAVVEFYDIAGLVKGAAKGEGLGNKFLSHIREVAAIVHVVRLFEDNDVIHVANKVDPKDDIQIIESELIFADLETLEKQKEPRMNALKEELAAFEVIKKLKKQLNQGLSARNCNLTDEEFELIRHLNLLTLKPVLYVFNVSEKQLENKEDTEKKIRSFFTNSHPEPGSGSYFSKTQMLKPASPAGRQVQHDKSYLYLNAKLENEIVVFSEEEQKDYLKQYNLEETGLNRLIKKAYEILGLISFLTAGSLEARAWTIKKGMLAPQAAGVIHTDFEKNFIKADVIPYQEFISIKGWQAAREQGKVQIAGRDYEVRDGDVIEFKVAVKKD